MFSLPKKKKKRNYIVASLKRSVNFQTPVSILLTIDFRIIHLGNGITLHLCWKILVGNRNETKNVTRRSVNQPYTLLNKAIWH